MRLSFFPARLAALAAFVILAPLTLSAQGREVTGTYNTTVNSPQGALKAVIVVKRDNGVFSGSLAADGFPVMPVTTVTPSDTGVALVVETPDGGVMVSMKFVDAATVKGTLVYQGMEMGLDGTFAPTGGVVTSAVGVYAVKTTQPLMGAAEFDVTCTVAKSATGALGGTCGNSENGDVPISTVVAEGNVVTISGDTPVGPYKMVMTVVGTTVEGTVSVANEQAKMKGTFTPR